MYIQKRWIVVISLVVVRIKNERFDKFEAHNRLLCIYSPLAVINNTISKIKQKYMISDSYKDLIKACNENIIYFANYLKTIRLQVANREKYIFDCNDLKQVEFNKLNDTKGLIVISLLDLCVSCKNLCLSETDWEKAYFIKNSFLTIYETQKKLQPKNGKTYFQQQIKSNRKELIPKFSKVEESLNLFIANSGYKKIEMVRNTIAAHMDKKFKKYFDTVCDLNGEEAALIIIDYLQILKSLLQITQKYDSILENN